MDNGSSVDCNRYHPAIAVKNSSYAKITKAEREYLIFGEEYARKEIVGEEKAEA